MFIDRPCWEKEAERPIPLRRGMYLRDGHVSRRIFYVLALNFQRELVALLPVADLMALAVLEEQKPIIVRFQDIETKFQPTLLGDGKEARKPLSRWERIQSGKLFRDP